MKKIFKKQTFWEWYNNFGEIFGDVLIKWADLQENPPKDIPITPPRGFHEYILAQYVAYRNELTTKRLVWATWFLAIGTILLSILTLTLK